MKAFGHICVWMAIAMGALGMSGQQADLVLPQLFDLEASDTIVVGRLPAPLSASDFMEPVFGTYFRGDSISLHWPPVPSDSLFCSDAFNWLDDAMFHQAQVRQLRQRYMIANPRSVRYNERLLPEPPRKFHMEVDPMTAKLVFVEDVPVIATPPAQTLSPEIAGVIKRRHWLRNFDAALQFSQAYVSPNWYQGGSNNLTMMLNLQYAVKLNQKYHPRLLCEMSVGYKLSVHGTPEDTLRNYNISEDLFQFTGKVGYKAWRNWFYSLTGTFKTQFFKNYEVNSTDLKAAFLSPSELNLGLGMTWDHQNPRKTFTVNASISPISWNMKTLINHDMNPEDYGIDPGRTVKHEFGSSGEVKMVWKLTYNITYTSRLFAFTNYKYAQGDWENTFNFAINRFLSTQLYVHLRYDSQTPRPEEGTRWHKWQVKEILSFGLNYNFATI